MKKILKPNKEIRELLKFTPLQYMIDSIEEKPELAEFYINEDNNSCLIQIGHYLFVAGNNTDEVLSYLNNQILTQRARNELKSIMIFFPNEEWKNAITNLFPNKYNIYERSLYRTKPNSIFDDSTKSQINISRINNDILNSKIENLDMIVDEVIGTNTYDSMEDFVSRGIGFTPIIDDKICGFCTSEYPTKTEIAVGIEVLEKYQKQGIAKAMTKMLLNEAYKKNLTVNWECWKNNIPSANTALSCGFEKVADYPVILIEL